MNAKTKTVLAILVGCVLLLGMVSQAQAVTISYDENIAADWSYTDDLNGSIPGTSGTSGNAASFSNATSSTEPGADSDRVYFTNTPGYASWNIGDAPTGKVWQLDSFTIWIAGNDSYRSSFGGRLYTSTDDVTYTEISGTYAELIDGDDQTWNCNRISYTFSADEVKGFKYLRLVSERSPQPRFYEVDAEISAVPEPATMVLLGLGSVGLLIRRRRRS